MVHLLQPATFPHGGGSSAVHGAGLALTCFAGPLQAVARLVRCTGGPNVLVLLGSSKLTSEAKLQIFRGRGARAVVEDLGWGEYVHGWSCMRSVVRGRPLSDVVSLLPSSPSYSALCGGWGPHWSALMTVAHWPRQGFVTPLTPKSNTLLSFPHLCEGVVSHSAQQLCWVMFIT